jgi:hypothetical protein
VDPVPDPLLLRKNLVAPGIEPGPLNLYPETRLKKYISVVSIFLHSDLF